MAATRWDIIHNSPPPAIRRSGSRSSVPKILAPLAAFLVAITCSLPSSGQEGERGKLLLDVFSPRDYGGHIQSWQIDQDHRGILWVANDEGVIEYDGERWRLITPLAELAVRAVAVSDDGTVYVGARGDLGRLEPGAQGGFRFVSLLDEVPRKQVGTITRILPTPDWIYFHDGARLLRRPADAAPRQAQMEVWPLTAEPPMEAAPGLSGTLAWLDGRVIATHPDTGLLELTAGTLAPVAGGEALAGRQVTALLPLSDSQILACSKQHGLYVWNGEEVRPWDTEASQHARRHEALDCRRLSDGRFALATFYAGVAFFDASGRLLRVLDRQAGLPDSTANALYEDAHQGLWVATNRGLVRLEMAPLEVFDRDLGFDGVARAIARHRGRLHAATSQGVFRLEPAATLHGTARFVRVEGAPVEQCRDLLSFAGRLLVATDHGLFEVAESRFLPEPWLPGAMRTLAASRDGRHVYVGTEGDGLHVVALRQGGFVDLGRIGPTSDTVIATVEDPRGRLWLRGLDGPSSQRIERLEIVVEGDEVRAVEARGFDRDDGLPAAERMYPFVWREQVHIGTSRGLYRHAEADDRFEPDPELGALAAAAGGRVATARADAQGRLWFNLRFERSARAEVDAAGHLRLSFPLERVDTRFFYDFYFERGGELIWAASEDGSLVRLEDRDSPDVRFPVRIRRIVAGGSPLWEGGTVSRLPMVPELAADQNALRFEYALPHFCGRASNFYQTRLVGLSPTWSAWSRDTHRELTALGNGRYRFEVRGRDVYGTVSEVAAWDFLILPPWYRTRWAWALYALTGVAAIAGAVAASRRKLEHERATNRRLRELDRMKDELVATTSHELRTPLYGMIGLAESLSSEPASGLAESTRSTLAAIVDSGRRLERMVHDLLDVTRLRERISGVREAVPPPTAVQGTPPGDSPDGFATPGGERILVVDDEPVVRLILARQLSSARYRVREVRSGTEALQALSEEAVELVLLDIMMPEMSGYEVCRKLRELHSAEHLPVIFLTAKNQVADVVEAFAAGGNDYLIKPASRDELLARVRTHLGLARAHRGRESLIARLESSNAELQRFNFTVSHDLRNPLITIKNFVGVLRRDIEAADRERFEKDLAALDAAASQMSRLLEELAEYSSLEREIRIDDVVPLEEVAREVAAPYAGNGADVRIAPDLPTVRGDRARVREVLRHLLDNAVGFHGGDGRPRIEVGARRSSEETVIFVRDDGPGIAPRYREKIFELFERLEPERPGTGVGLALVRRIVELHGGRVWVESPEDGPGSTFCFTLPSHEH